VLSFSLNGNSVPSPKGWDTLLFSREVGENNLIKKGFSLDISFCGNEYKELFDKHFTDVCAISEVGIYDQCNAFSVPKLLTTATIKTSDIEFDCNLCEATVSLSINNNETILLDNLSEKYTIPYEYIDADMFGYIDGFEYYENSSTITWLKAMELLLSQITKNTINLDVSGSLFANSYSEQVMSVTLPNTIALHDILTIEYKTTLGECVTLNVEIFNPLFVSDYIKRGLLTSFGRWFDTEINGVSDNINNACQVIGRISDIEILDGWNFNIITDFEFEYFNIKDSLGNPIGSTTIIQPFNLGLKDLLLSRDLFTGKDVYNLRDITFSDLWNPIAKLFNLYGEVVGNVFKIMPYTALFNNNATALPITSETLTVKLDETFVKENYNFYGAGDNEGYVKYSENWSYNISDIFGISEANIAGIPSVPFNVVSLPIVVPHTVTVSVGQGLTNTNPTITAMRGGIVDIDGVLGYNDNGVIGVNIFVRLFINGVFTGSQYVFTTTGVGVNTVFAYNFDSVCLVDGDIIRIELSTDSVPLLSFNQSDCEISIYWVSSGFCLAPLKEDCDTLAKSDYTDCGGNYSVELDGKHYFGLGQRVSAILLRHYEISDGEVIFFLGDGAGNARKFRRVMHYEGGIGFQPYCNCSFSNIYVPYYFYNIPFQSRYMPFYYNGAIPSNIEVFGDSVTINDYTGGLPVPFGTCSHNIGAKHFHNKIYSVAGCMSYENAFLINDLFYRIVSSGINCLEFSGNIINFTYDFGKGYITAKVISKI